MSYTRYVRSSHVVQENRVLELISHEIMISHEMLISHEMNIALSWGIRISINRLVIISFGGESGYCTEVLPVFLVTVISVNSIYKKAKVIFKLFRVYTSVSAFRIV